MVQVINDKRRHAATGVFPDFEVLEKTIAIDVEDEVGVVERIIGDVDLRLVLIDLHVAELQAWLHRRVSVHLDIIR